MSKGGLALGVVVAALAAYLFWDFREEEKTNQRKETEAALFDFKVDQVNAVTIEKAGVKTRLSRSVEGWKLEEPMQDSADSSYTDNFVDTLVKEKYLEVAKSGEGIDWKVYGLDQPMGKITLTTQAGVSKTVEVSPKLNFEQNAMGRFTGEERALVLPAAWQTYVGRQALEFRDKRLLRFAISSVDRVELKNAHGNLDVSLREGKWIATKKPELKLDQNRVREMLTQINETKALEFPVFGRAPTALEKSGFGLDRPSITLKMKIKDKDWTASFTRAKNKAEYALVSEPQMILHLTVAALQKFESMELEALRDKKLPFEFDLAAVESMEVKTPIKKTRLVKKENQWQFAEKTDGPQADSAKVAEMLQQIRKSSAALYAETSLTKLFKEKSSLKLTKSDGSTLYQLSWGDPIAQKNPLTGGATVLAKSSAHPQVFILEPATLQALLMADLTQNPVAEPTEPDPAELPEAAQ